jgi:hypothetical protein
MSASSEDRRVEKDEVAVPQVRNAGGFQGARRNAFIPQAEEERKKGISTTLERHAPSEPNALAVLLEPPCVS